MYSNDQKKVVLFVIHELTMGGAERVTVNIINNIDRSKFDVHLCIFKNVGSLVEELSNSVVIHDLGVSRVLFGIPKFLKFIIKVKPNIVFSSITHVNLLLGLLIPIIRMFINGIKFISREVNNPSVRAKYLKKSRVIDYIYRLAIKNFDVIVAQSSFMKSDICNYYSLNSRKVFVIPNPVETQDILKKSLMKTEQIFDSKKINLLAVGGLRPQKGYTNLLKVMSLLSDRYHLSILGEGPERNNIQNLITEKGLNKKVSLLGLKNNPYQFIAQANILVVSSLYEGFPNVVIEANVCGKFVIAFECPGINNEIITNGLNGNLIEQGNYNAFSNAISSFVLREYNPSDIIKTAKRYDVHNVIDSYNRLFA